MLTPRDVLRWYGRLGSELATMPRTLASARRLLVELPDTLERLIDSLQGPLADVGAALPSAKQSHEYGLCCVELEDLRRGLGGSVGGAGPPPVSDEVIVICPTLVLRYCPRNST